MIRTFTTRFTITLILLLTCLSTIYADAPPPNYSSVLSKKEIRRQKRIERRKLRKTRRQQRRIKRVEKFLKSRRGKWFLIRFFDKLFDCHIVPRYFTRYELWRASVCCLKWLLGALILTVIFGTFLLLGTEMGLGWLFFFPFVATVILVPLAFFTFLIGIFL